MISKQQQKYIQSLQIKKYRQEYQSFLVEGAKSVLELLNSDFLIDKIYVTEKFAEQIDSKSISIELATQAEIEKIGTLQSNDSALAIVKMKPNQAIICNDNEYVLVLDDIRDPGNLGTIIRIADWYGINKIICSENTVDFYNPKVIASTMGSFTRIKIWYGDLEKYFNRNNNLPVYGTFISGENIHKTNFSKNGFIIIGNESNGIRPEIEKKVTDKITIPRFGNAESLNAGIATAIVLDNIRRYN
ncbi:MAG: RNA methyltransferase [Spirosomaceae bacterium]|jgi:TrmH family RNA methyltransferase|nr:RNA methyltransferase [Spirosomataceae bacterium]